jgi:uncharacterized protein (DUF1015 family)
VPDLGAVIAPPYDVISPEKRRMLIERDPHNVIQLILPEGDDQSRYDNAARLYREWIAQRVLVREEGRTLYPYAQIFEHPVTGERVERRGFIGALRLSPFSEGKILPHERTLSGPKADRLKLMVATDANLEPIFGVYRDPAGTSSERLRDICATSAPFIAVTDSDGVEHRLWRARDFSDVAGFQNDLLDATVFIVDGHHRYETALNYQRLRREHDPAIPEGAGFDSIMIFLSPSSDPGLVILPTHRIVHSLQAFDLDALKGALAPNFEIEERGDRAPALAKLETAADRPAFLLLSGNRILLARLKSDVDINAMVDAALPEELKGLDVTVLHSHIFERLLGITQAAQAEQRNLRYVKSYDEAFDAAAEPENQLVVVMNPTRLDQVEDVAASGSVMPQKSTYFYPKLASGLLFNALGE